MTHVPLEVGSGEQEWLAKAWKVLPFVLPAMVYLRYLSQEVCAEHVTASRYVGQIRAPIHHP